MRNSIGYLSRKNVVPLWSDDKNLKSKLKKKNYFVLSYTFDVINRNYCLRIEKAENIIDI